MPQTLKLRADSAADIAQAAQILRHGGTVAFPTETVYGLGANALDAEAVTRIFEAKKRPIWDPLIVHISSASELASYTAHGQDTAARVERLSEHFWPGPLTLLLPKSPAIPDVVSAGRPLAGFRVPKHPVAQALLQAAALPIAAPSANVFGHTSPTTANHVLADLDGRIDAVLDGGPTLVGVESTVIDPTQTPIMLYRPGAVTAAQIKAATEIDVAVFEPSEKSQSPEPESLPSPGVGIRHYAPRARVVLVKDGEDSLREAVSRSSEKTGVLLPMGWTVPGDAVVQRWGNWAMPDELAAHLFAGLRALDAAGVTIIFCPLPPAGGLNDAIRDRLMKAARDA